MGFVIDSRGCRLGRHSPAFPDKGHQLALGSRSSVGL